MSMRRNKRYRDALTLLHARIEKAPEWMLGPEVQAKFDNIKESFTKVMEVFDKMFKPSGFNDEPASVYEPVTFK